MITDPLPSETVTTENKVTIINKYRNQLINSNFIIHNNTPSEELELAVILEIEARTLKTYRLPELQLQLAVNDIPIYNDIELLPTLQEWFRESRLNTLQFLINQVIREYTIPGLVLYISFFFRKINSSIYLNHLSINNDFWSVLDINTLLQKYSLPHYCLPIVDTMEGLPVVIERCLLLNRPLWFREYYNPESVIFKTVNKNKESEINCNKQLD